MGLPVINGYTFATWNGIIYPPRRPVVTFDSPVLRGTGASVLPQRSPESTVVTQAFLATRSEADALAASCYLLHGYLINASDDEGVVYSNLFVKGVNCSKPMKKMGETTSGTAGLIYHMIVTWAFIAPLPENS